MAEYIERDEAINAVYESFADGKSPYGALISIPAADVRPVVRGRWNVGSERGWECSVCGIESNNTYPICPYCGADMREETIS